MKTDKQLQRVSVVLSSANARISHIVIFTGVFQASAEDGTVRPKAFLIPTALPPSVSDRYFFSFCCIALILFCFVFVRCPCSHL